MDYSRRTPLDLPQLRLWLGYLIKNYDALAANGEIGYRPPETAHYRASLVSLARACEGQFDRPLKARIRELLALGVAGYGIAGGVPAGVPFAGELIVDFAACALWPLACSPDLPRDWLDAFIAITSCPRMATPVVRARYGRRIQEPMSAPEFRQALTEVNFAWGVRNLLRDLSDPRRGGGALAAMAIACTRYAPRRGATQQRVARWALVSALGGLNGGLNGGPNGGMNSGLTGRRACDPLTTLSEWVTHCVSHPHAFMTPPDARPQPATLTANPASRPVVFEEVGGR